MGGWSKRSASMGAIFASAAAAMFSQRSIGRPVITRDSTPLGIRVAKLAARHGNKQPSATKAGPGRYHRGGPPKFPYVSGETFVCAVDRIPLYMNAGERRRYLAAQEAAHG